MINQIHTVDDFTIRGGSGGGGGSTPGNLGTVTSVNINGGTTGFIFSGGPIVSSGIFVVSGTLGIANGGTGGTSQVLAARNILPPQATLGGYMLYTDGTDPFWGPAPGGGGTGEITGSGVAGRVSVFSGATAISSFAGLNWDSVRNILNSTAVIGKLYDKGGIVYDLLAYYPDMKAMNTATGGAMTGLSHTLTVSGTGDTFVAADVGRSVVVAGALSTGAPLVTTVATYVSPTEVTLTSVAPTTISGKTVYFGDDLGAKLNAILALMPHYGGILQIPSGTYLCSQVVLNKAGVIIRGQGMGDTVIAFMNNATSCFAVGSAAADLAMQERWLGGIKDLTIIGAVNVNIPYISYIHVTAAGRFHISGVEIQPQNETTGIYVGHASWLDNTIEKYVYIENVLIQSMGNIVTGIKLQNTAWPCLEQVRFRTVAGLAHTSNIGIFVDGCEYVTIERFSGLCDTVVGTGQGNGLIAVCATSADTIDVLISNSSLTASNPVTYGDSSFAIAAMPAHATNTVGYVRVSNCDCNQLPIIFDSIVYSNIYNTAVRHTSADGISIKSCEQASVIDCTSILNNLSGLVIGAGIRSGSCSGVRVIGSTIQSNGLYGISIPSGTSFYVAGNTVNFNGPGSPDGGPSQIYNLCGTDTRMKFVGPNMGPS